jgi:hypothetical protein
MIRVVQFVPGTPIPTDLYEVEIRDSDGLNLLKQSGTTGDNVSSGATVTVPESGTLFFPCWGTTLELVIANAGNLGQGSVILWIKGT